MFTFFCNIGLNYLLIALYQFEGAAFAQSAARILQLLLLAGACSLQCLSHTHACTAARLDYAR